MTTASSVADFDFTGFQPPQPPEIALSNLRAVRLHRGVGQIGPKADQFEQTVSAFGTGEAGMKKVVESFAGVLKSFHDTARAASRQGLISTQTREAVDDVLGSLAEEFEASFRQVHSNLRRVNEMAPEMARDFFAEASVKMERLKTFWDNAASNVEKPAAGPRMN